MNRVRVFTIALAVMIACCTVGWFSSVTNSSGYVYATEKAVSVKKKSKRAKRTSQKSVKKAEFEDRWFYASFGLRSDEETDELCQLIQNAGKNGLNGMLWACGMEGCGHWSETVKVRFGKIKKVADESGVEIIPILWSIGYGTALGRNENLVEGIPIENLRVVVKNGEVELAPGVESVEIKNPGMETFKGNKMDGYDFHDLPGTVSFPDTDVKHTGNASLRLENFAQNAHGHGRVLQTVKVTPCRNYRISVWYKTEGLTDKHAFRLQIYSEDNRMLSSAMPVVAEGGTQEWQKQTLIFSTTEKDEKIRIYMGVWGGTTGKMWLDDLQIESIDLTAPLQRPGTPIVVKDVKSGKKYKEGKDFVPAKFRLGEFRKGVVKSPIQIPEGSRIQEGTELSLTYYVPAMVMKGQVSTCMSEPEVYEFFEESAEEIMKLLAPKKWFLSMDEIRAANTCAACEKSNLTLDKILGRCITKQYRTIQKVQPGAEVYIWSDMLDPNHNCHADYIKCRGDFTGVWKWIPKELIISCWYYEKREESMKFFSDLGFRTQAAAYYDVDTLDSSRDWLDVCRRTPNCTGIMYTTWNHKYALMEGFAKMLQEDAENIRNKY